MAKKREIMGRLVLEVDKLASDYRAVEAESLNEDELPTSIQALLRRIAELSDVYDELLEWEDGSGPAPKVDSADYYSVKLADGSDVPRARCKKCGTEMDPKAIRRHVKGTACAKRIAAIADKKKPKNGTDGESATST